MFTTKQFQDDLKAILDAARNRSRTQFYLSLLHIVDSPQLQAVLQENNTAPVPAKFQFNLTPKSLHSVTNLTAYTNYLDSQNEVEFLTMYAKLYSYLQSLETKYTYKVIGNLLRVLLDHEPDGELYDNLHSGYQCYTSIVALHNQLVVAGTQFELFVKWDTFMNRSLRNAIAHNDIYLHSDSRSLLIPSLLLRSVTNPDEADGITATFSFDDLLEYYNNATNFSEGFKNLVSQYVDLGERY
jgi:hypothetical protein